MYPEQRCSLGLTESSDTLIRRPVVYRLQDGPQYNNINRKQAYHSCPIVKSGMMAVNYAPVVCDGALPASADNHNRSRVQTLIFRN
jgi:uncharacterized protein (UPF0179 family)